MNATLNCCLPDKKMQQVALQSLYWQTLHERILFWTVSNMLKIRSFPTRLSHFFFFWGGGRSSLATCRRPKPSYGTNSTVQRVQSFDLKTAGFCWVKGIVKHMMRWKITVAFIKKKTRPRERSPISYQLRHCWVENFPNVPFGGICMLVPWRVGVWEFFPAIR